MSPHPLNSESFRDWAHDEDSGEGHQSNASFTDWLNDEIKEHGDIPLSEWGQKEKQEVEHHFGAFSLKKSPLKIPCQRCGAKGYQTSRIPNTQCEKCKKWVHNCCLFPTYDSEGADLMTCQDCAENFATENPYSHDEDFRGEDFRKNWIHLQGVGRVTAVRAETLKSGDWIGWDRGYSSQVVSIKPKGKDFLYITIKPKINRFTNYHPKHQQGKEQTLLKKRTTMLHRITPRMLGHWRAEDFNAYGFGDSEGPPILGKYSLRDLIDSAAGPQGRLSYDESSSWDYLRDYWAESKAKPSYSPSANLKIGATMADEMKTMKSIAVLGGALLIGYHWDKIMDMGKSLLGGFSAENRIARREIEEAAHYNIGEVNFQGGEGGLPANEEAPAPVKYDYNPVAGPTQQVFDPSTMPSDVFKEF